MNTLRALSSSPSHATPAAAKIGKLAGLVILAGSLAGLAPAAHADEFHTVLGAGIGAVAGAAIGNHVGGRNGAIVGAGAGGLVGATIASQHHGYGQPRVVNHYPQPVTYYQPQPQYRVVQPVTYYQPAVVTWQAPAPQHRHHWREERRDHYHGHHHGHHGHGHHDHRR